MSAILITGGNGMVGRNFRALCEARGLALLSPASRDLDLLDARATLSYLKAHRPDIVIHAAGRVGGIEANIAAPVAFLAENWTMGQNLVLAAREAGVRKLVNLGSSCMYPANSPDPLQEDAILSGPLEPTNEGYALAKCAVARLCQYICCETLDLCYKTLIPSNLYGPYDSFDPARSHLVPAIIHKLHQAKVSGTETVEIWGSGEARREFLYAGDLAEALLMAVEKFESLPDLLNIGTGRDFTVNEHYRIAAEVIGYTGAFTHDLSRPTGIRRKLLDVSRATGWGFTARTGLAEGIARTYRFYLSTGHADALPPR